MRAGLGLARGERLLAYAMLAGGGWVVATSVALVVVDPVTGPDAGPGTPRARHLWHEVSEATWSPEERTVVVDLVSSAEPSLRLRIDDHDSYLPEVIRERVMSTYVLSQRVPVRGKAGVTVAVRRHSRDGTLFTQAVADAGVDLERPQVADQVTALTRELASQVGLGV